MLDQEQVMARSINKCKCFSNEALEDSGCSFQNSKQPHTNSAKSNLSQSTVPLGENRKLFGSEAPAFFLERSWSREGISANSHGRLGDEDALGAIADQSFVKEDGGLAAMASEAGDETFVFS